MFFLLIGVASRNVSYWGTRRILAALKRRGVEARYLKTDEIQLMVEDNGATAYFHDLPLSDLDLIIPRIGRSLTDFGVLLLNHLELLHVPTTLSKTGLMLARNKFLALQELRRAKVRIPTSVLLGSGFKVGDLVEQMPPPFVMKLLSGTQGIGVMKVENPKDAGPIVDTLVELKQLICIQKFLPNPGEDVRVLIVGGKVVAAMRRLASMNEWRSNIHLGGTGLAHTPTKEQEDLALRATAALKAEIAGVDIIQAEDGPYVIEVNVSPGFKGLLKATGIDASEAMAEYALEKAKR